MQTWKKVVLIIVIALVGAVLLSAAIAALVGFDLATLFNDATVTSDHQITQEFDSIFIQTTNADIVLLPSQDGECRVECVEREKMPHAVTVKDGTLHIEVQPEIKFGFFTAQTSVTVYLPDRLYDKVELDTVSSSIISEQRLKVDYLMAETVSGDLSVKQLDARTATIQTVSGGMSLSNLNVTEHLSLTTTSGDFWAEYLHCDTLSIQSTSSNCEMIDVYVAGLWKMESVSGDIFFVHSDAASLSISSVSGNVQGSLLTQKTFDVQSTSGSIRVPKEQSGGDCRIETVSGNVYITYE
jgi:DUF4097 and DUF4098 domain-containing protein YvlB